VCSLANSDILVESISATVHDSHISGPGYTFIIGFKMILIDLLHSETKRPFFIEGGNDCKRAKWLYDVTVCLFV